LGPGPFVVELFYLFFGAVFVGIGTLVVFPIMKALKVKITIKGIIFIIATFFLFFLLSSVWVRERVEGVTLQFFGGDTVYRGARLLRGFPLIYVGTFEPYDANATSLYLYPQTVIVQGVFIDFVFWMVVSTVLFCTVDKLSRKRQTRPSQSPASAQPLTGQEALQKRQR
jgi:membrane protein implicated in regulation of membrane protease activity